MQIQEQHIFFQKSGRFFTFGNPEKADHLLVALHGYGQLAGYFIRKFNTLDPDRYFVICPEGPHRFYQSGTSGRVGASWMTREDRLTDIDDYVRFLDTLLVDVEEKYTFKEKTLLGFSQGGATASRWVGYGKSNFHNFLLWAAVFPPDMDATARTKFNTQKNYFIIGDNDEYTTLDKAKDYYDALNQHGMNFEFRKFEGSHTVDINVLKTLI